MHYISHIHLENRILIRDEKEYEIINLSKEYGIPVVIGTDGNFENGPYIERIYKKSDSMLTVNKFTEFLGKLVPLIDMYRGCKIFTFAEMTVKAIIEIADKKLETPSKVEIAIFMDPDTDKFIIKSLNPSNEKIIILNPWQQKRITRTAYIENKTKMLVPA